MQSEPHSPMLWRRCVQCPSETPTCPDCPSGESCLLQAQSCDSCASAACVGTASLPGDAPAQKSSTPAIAGGVAGGVLFIIIVTFLVWWFCIRSRRQEWDEQTWSETDHSIHGVEKRDQSGLNREARESTRSLRSIASTVPTRASNVIQIAYIPGVTNRSPTHSPGLLQPPIPPVPMASPNSEPDRRSYVEDDMRDSATSDHKLRQSLSPSLARSSGATFYPSSVELSARSAQQALRAKAAMVRVNKTGNGTPPDAGTPADLASPGMMSSPIVARNVTARPIEVKKSNSGKKRQDPSSGNLDAIATNSKVSLQAGRAGETIEEEDGDGDDDAGTRLISPTARPQHESTRATALDDGAPGRKQSQFTDAGSSTSSVSELAGSRPPPLQLNAPFASRFSFSPPSTAAPHTGRKHQKSGSINSLIEEATSRAARQPSHGGLGSINEAHNQSSSHPLSQGSRSESRSQGRSDSASLSGPFSDANEVWEAGSRSGSASRTSRS